MAILDRPTEAELETWSVLTVTPAVTSAFAPTDERRGWPDTATLVICEESPGLRERPIEIARSVSFARNEDALDEIGRWIVAQRDRGLDVLVYGSWRPPTDTGTHIHVKAFERGRVRYFANLHLTDRESVRTVCANCGHVDRNRPDEPATTVFSVDACNGSYEYTCDILVEERLGFDRYGR